MTLRGRAQARGTMGQGVTIRNTYYTYYVLSIRIIHNTRDGQIWYTRGNIIIHFYTYKKQLPARGELG